MGAPSQDEAERVDSVDIALGNGQEWFPGLSASRKLYVLRDAIKRMKPSFKTINGFFYRAPERHQLFFDGKNPAVDGIIDSPTFYNFVRFDHKAPLVYDVGEWSWIEWSDVKTRASWIEVRLILLGRDGLLFNWVVTFCRPRVSGAFKPYYSNKSEMFLATDEELVRAIEAKPDMFARFTHHLLSYVQDEAARSKERANALDATARKAEAIKERFAFK